MVGVVGGARAAQKAGNALSAVEWERGRVMESAEVDTSWFINKLQLHTTDLKFVATRRSWKLFQVQNLAVKNFICGEGIPTPLPPSRQR
jgi:hypothetical protein